MGYTALYREWRPKTFDSVVGQKHITVTLKNQILKERIAHAYLFCGTRGTGKTSTAKIFAKALNCLNPIDGEPCNECQMCKKINNGIAIDVIELDAASNNGVDNIRDIIEEVQYPPQEAKFKVYIMDEVHMLSPGAVNAFLKTLEEPPKNVVFILATTDPQKLPITILSRCQRFDFKRIKNDEISERLRKIVEQQGVYADDNSLNLIARTADGAMRDALSILDQAISMGNGKVDYDQVTTMLGLVTSEHLLNMTDYIVAKDIEKSIRLIDEIVLTGKDSLSFIKDLLLHFRNLMIVKVSHNPEEIIDMSEEHIKLVSAQAQKISIEEVMRDIRVLQEYEEQAKWSKQTRIYLELAVIKMCKIEYDTSNEVLLGRLNKMEEIIKQGKITVACERIVEIPDKREVERDSKPKQMQVRPVEEVNSNSALTIESVKKSWKDLLDTFKSRRHMVIYASLITGKLLDFNRGVVEILYEEQYAFNKQRLEKEDNRRIIEDIFAEILKEKVKIKYIVDYKQNNSVNEKSAEERLIEAFGENMVEIIDE